MSETTCEIMYDRINGPCPQMDYETFAKGFKAALEWAEQQCHGCHCNNINEELEKLNSLLLTLQKLKNN